MSLVHSTGPFGAHKEGLVSSDGATRDKETFSELTGHLLLVFCPVVHFGALAANACARHFAAETDGGAILLLDLGV